MSSKTILLGLSIFQCGSERSVHERPSWELAPYDRESERTKDFIAWCRDASTECCFNERAGECGVVHFTSQFFVLGKSKSIPIRIGGHWKWISETNLKSRWKWTERVKLKEDKQVGQNFIELKHMAVVILLNYLKTKEMLTNCKAKWLECVLTLPIYRGRKQHGKGREAGDKGTGNGRAGYGRQEVLTPLSPPQ